MTVADFHPNLARTKPLESDQQETSAPIINSQGTLLLGSRPGFAVSEPSNVPQASTRKPRVKITKQDDSNQSNSTIDNDVAKEFASRTYRTTMSQKAPAIRRERHEDNITV